MPGFLWHNTRVMWRWIGFFLAMALGAAGGLYYGWVLDPVKYVDTAPDTLRVDYLSDYVLMVAEVYRADGNLAQAAQRLSLLGEKTPGEVTSQALDFASQHGYAEADLDAMRALSAALQAWNPLLEPAQP